LYIPFNLRKTGYQTYINGISRYYKSVRMRRFLCFFFPCLHGKRTYYNHPPHRCQEKSRKKNTETGPKSP